MVPRTLAVMSCLVLALATGSLWAQNHEPDHSKPASPASNIEGWHEEDADELMQDWTWFGMGYEFRNTAIRPGHSIATGIPIKKTNGKK
jgi:hypothetical protein